MEYIIPSITFLIGLGAALVFQYYQSKEVLKQIVYKEKIVAYQKLIDKSTELRSDLSLAANYSDSDYLTALNKVMELELCLIKNAYLISDETLDYCATYIKFAIEVVKSKKDNPQVIDTSHTDLINSVRNDLGIRELSKEIRDLFTKFPSLGLSKSKNKN